MSTTLVNVKDLQVGDVIDEGDGQLDEVLTFPKPGGEYGRWVFQVRTRRGVECQCAIQPSFDMNVRRP